MIVKHHENEKNACNQKIKKTGQYGCYGDISRGKYILVTRLLLLIRLGIANVRKDAKNDHGNKEQYEKMGYGVPSVLMCKNFEKTTVNTNIRDKGWTMAHVVPKSDCLYRALMSRRAIFMSSS